MITEIMVPRSWCWIGGLRTTLLIADQFPVLCQGIFLSHSPRAQADVQQPHCRRLGHVRRFFRSAQRETESLFLVPEHDTILRYGFDRWPFHHAITLAITLHVDHDHALFWRLDVGVDVDFH